MQRDSIAIADLEVKSAELEAYRANLHRRKAEVKSQLREEILDLVLKYEAAEREYSLIESQLASHQVQQQIMKIDYQFGNGSTSSYLASVNESEILKHRLAQYRYSQLEAVRKILQMIED